MQLLRSILGLDPAPPDLERYRRWIFLFIVLVAVALRFALIGNARFSGDEGAFYGVARDIARFRTLPGVGPPISGGTAALPGPLFFVLMAIPQWIWSAPEACMALTALQGVGTVIFLYLAMRRPFGEAGAAFAALLFACSPWSAFASDRITTVIMFPTAVAIWCAVRLRENPKSKLLALFVVACGLMPQMHLSFPVLWIPLLALVASTVLKWRWRWFFVGVVITAAFYGPYIGYELRTNWGNLRAYRVESRTATRTEGGWRNVPLYVVRNLTLDTSYYENTGYWGAPDEVRNARTMREGSFARPKHALRTLTLYASFAALMLALFASVFEAVRRARAEGWKKLVTPFSVAMWLSILTTTGLIAYAGKPVYGHYVQPIQVFLFFVYGSLGLVAMRYRYTRLPAIALALIFAAGGIESTWTISSRLDARLGIRAERHVVFQIMRDGLEQGFPENEPVHLELGFFGAMEWYGQVSHYLADDRARFAWGAPRRRYRVQIREEPPPWNWDRTRPPSPVGPVVLYQLR